MSESNQPFRPEDSIKSLTDYLESFNVFEMLFLDLLDNPSTALRYAEQVVKPFVRVGWLRQQIEHSIQKSRPLSLSPEDDYNSEIRLEIRRRYEYENADVYLIHSVFKHYQLGEVDFLVVTKNPLTNEAQLLTIYRPVGDIPRFHDTHDVDVSSDFL